VVYQDYCDKLYCLCRIEKGSCITRMYFNLNIYT